MKHKIFHTRAGASFAGACALAASALASIPASAADSGFAVVGSLQNEVSGCRDWDEKCTQTEMTRNSRGVYEYKAILPAGKYEYKIVGGHSMDNSWGNGSANMPISVAGRTKVTFRFDPRTHKVGVWIPTKGRFSPEDGRLVKAPGKRGNGESFYFVMTDRFANGDPSNDTGGYGSDRMASGFDPTHKGFYQGGDIAGLRSKLDYIKGLGTTAIWLTPSFKNRPVQGSGANVSAGYHGYWITDFTQIDPHLGTNEELAQLVRDAHARGMKVYFDIIVNHTADLISYEGQQGGSAPYVTKEQSPYKDASGTPFDPSKVSTFPEMSAQTSFPYVPKRTGKVVPDELNDVTLYHNRGDSTWTGESVTYGDFVGLDDVMTENPKTVRIFADVYKKWMDFGIDGFRIDTVKHVDFEFWKKWTKEINDHAKKSNPKFFTFGEVYDGAATARAPYTWRTGLGATLDFGFQEAVTGYAAGKPSKSVGDFFATDDMLTTPTSGAADQPTFLGNHDMGRASYMIAGAGKGDTQARTILAHKMMFLMRGQPVVYYGDEQGFMGTGGDQDSRQSMFASKTAEYVNQPLADGTQMGSKDRYSTSAPIYKEIASVAKLRHAHPGLENGAQIELYRSDDSPVYAFARVDRKQKSEYVVAVNNSKLPAKARFKTMTPKSAYKALYGASGSVRSARNGEVTVEVPPLSAVVYKADKKLAKGSGSIAVTPDSGQALVRTTSTLAGQDVTQSLVPVSADLGANRWAETTFSYRIAGSPKWRILGTASGPKPRVFHDVTDIPDGTLVEYRAVSVDAKGRTTVDSGFGSVGVDQSAGQAARHARK